jgi:hypothetical protein
MRHQFFVAFLVFTVAALAIDASSQTVARKDPPGTPMLRLKVIPSKEDYVLKEDVLTKTIFTNQSDKILCFPKLEREIEIPAQGYLTIKVVGPPGASEREVMLEHIDGPGLHRTREELLLDIKQRWIKLPPNETYTTGLERVPATPDSPGQWQLTETYLPPQGSFGGDSYRNELKSAAHNAGCTLPETKVSAETITVNVVALPEKN